jgi:predicted PurR-regulated permease PerM
MDIGERFYTPEKRPISWLCNASIKVSFQSFRVIEGTHLLDSRILRALCTTLIFATALALVVVARKTFLILIFAALFAYLMEPMVSREQRSIKGKRVRAVAVTYLAFWLVIAGLSFLAGRTLIEQSRSFLAKAPETAQKMQTGEIAKEFGQKHGLSEQTSSRMQRYIQQHQDNIQKVLSYFKDQVRRYAGGVIAVLLVPLLAMLFPQDKTRFPMQIVETYSTGRNRAYLTSVIQDCDRMLGEYM